MKSVMSAILSVMIVLVARALATDSSVPFILADLVHAQKITGWPIILAMIDSGVDFGDPGLYGSIVPGISIVRNGDCEYDGGRMYMVTATAARVRGRCPPEVLGKKARYP